MATEDVTPIDGSPRTKRDSFSVRMDMGKKLSQLEALLEMTYCDASEEFNAMDDRLRDNYLWACSDMVKDCIELDHELAKYLNREASHA